MDIVKHIGNELYTNPKEKFPCRVENGYFIPFSDEWEDKRIHARGGIFMQAFDKKTREGAVLVVIHLGDEIVWEDSPPADYIPHIKVRSEGDEIEFMGEIPKNWNCEHSIVLEHNGRAILSTAIYHSKNISVENYRIINGGGMGLYSVGTENISVKEFKLINNELSHGVVVNSADGIHFVASRGQIEITDSIFEGIVDDALNIHSNYYYVDSTEDNIIYARRSDKSHGLNAYCNVFSPNDKIALYEGLTLKERKKYTVLSSEIINKWLVKLTLNEKLSDIFANDLIENLSTNANITIKKSHFAKANTHLCFRARGNIIVDDCERPLPILLTGDTNYWFESSPVKDMRIKNCKFIGNRAKIRIIPEFTPCD